MSLLRTDPALLGRFRRGEREALERVYWGYVDYVEAMVRRGFHLFRRDGAVHIDGMRLRHDIADVVQETFTRAFGEPARLAYDGLRDYGPFLLTITRNLLVDRARRQGRELTGGDLSELDQAAAVLDETPLGDEATMKAVREYLAGLPAELRGVHEQRYVRGVSQEEAGRALGLSRQQIRTLEKRLHEGLATWLERAGLTAEEEPATRMAAPTYSTTKGALK